MTQEALKLALEALEELNNTNSYWWQEVADATVAKIDPAISAIKEALAQPEKTLPRGIGDGLVAIKTLLSRDPCVHANKAIQMIDAIIAEQPAQRTEQNFCPRCGKRTQDIHTCTPPQD